MMVRESTEEPPETDRVAQQIAEDERRRSGAFLRDYLARHRIDLESDVPDLGQSAREPGGDVAQ